MSTCTVCQHENAETNEYCGRCGAALREQALIISRPAPLPVPAAELATPQMKALAATVALGVVTLLAEAGLAYLQRRLAGRQRPSLSLRRKKQPGSELVIRPAEGEKPGRVVTIISERVIEETRWGRPARRVVERFAWRGEERSD